MPRTLGSLRPKHVIHDESWPYDEANNDSGVAVWVRDAKRFQHNMKDERHDDAHNEDEGGS
jgi:hypothetical protein